DLIWRRTFMKGRLIYALLSLLLSGPILIVAQEPLVTKEGQIRSLEEQERMAVLKEDLSTLERLWSDQLIVNNPQNEISANRNAVFDRIKSGLIRYSQFDRQI